MGVNPYAAPGVDDAPAVQHADDAGIPRAAVMLARGHLLLVGLGLVAGGTSALRMRLALWHPEGSGDHEGYAQLFTLHGTAMVFAVMMPAIFGVLANLAVPEAVRARRMPTLPLGWLGLVVWGGGATVIVVHSMTAAPWAAYTPQLPTALQVGPLLVAAGMLLTFVHLAAVALANIRTTSTAARVVVAAILLPLAWQCVRIAIVLIDVARDPFLHLDPLGDIFADTLAVDDVAALAVVTHLATRGSDSSDGWARTAAIALVGVAGWFVLTSSWLVAIIGFGAKLTLVIVWLRVIVRRSSLRQPEVVVLALGIAPALLLFSLARSLLAALSVDAHLHDTYFLVGQFHLGAAIVVLAFLAGLLAWSEPLFRRTPQPSLARFGGGLVGIGVVGQTIAMLVLGNRGMPRRYASYVPQLTELHRTIGSAALAIATGGVLLVLAWILGRAQRAR